MSQVVSREAAQRLALRFMLHNMTISAAQKRLLAVGAWLLWCAALMGVGIHRAPDSLSLWLAWNLFLGALPLVWSAAFRRFFVQGHRATAALFFGLWLLFFPNAPYLLTDLVHLGPRPGLPLWFMLTLLLSCAGAGTLMGYLSLAEVHREVEKRFGPLVGWLMVGVSSLLCGFGIYLGRFLRWNSWDALTQPLALAHTLVALLWGHGPFPHPVSVTLAFGGGLLLGYVSLRAMASAFAADR